MPGAEEQLEKLKLAYKREKQYASVIEKLEAEKGINEENTEIKELEKQITNLKKTIKNSQKITEEERLKIEKARKELLILWKIEIDSTISNKKEALELPETTEDLEENNIVEETKRAKGIIFKLKKAKNGKHACI